MDVLLSDPFFLVVGAVVALGLGVIWLLGLD